MSGIVFAMILSLFPGQEVDATQMNRYAVAISAVVSSDPLPFQGRHAKEKTAALLLAVAYHESGLRESIEYCRFSPLPGMTQDDGRSVGLWQALDGYARFGHSREEICGDVELQARLALRYLVMTMRKCKTLAGSLSAYNQNRCEPSIYSARVGILHGKILKKLSIH